MTTAAIIVAAGRGTRAGGGTPKQWRDLAGQPVAAHALQAFASHPDVDHLALVLHPDDIDTPLWPRQPAAQIVTGGATRQASVMAGLAALPPDVTRVLIHAAARPLVSHAVIDRVLAALHTAPGAAPALPVTDALWQGTNGCVTGTTDRTNLYRAQTPQGFHRADITAAHNAWTGDAADDVEIARAHGVTVTIVPGDEANLKLTYKADFDRARTLKGSQMDIRLGNGFDVHRFGPGDHVTLCGVTLPYSRGLQGHSDADVGMHAVTDAIYGALAMGDIGQHFPPTDPQWKGAASQIFLTHACDLARSMGFAISNADCTLICETPKIGPHAKAMKTAMATIMGLPPDRVSVKATTSEQLGFTGRGEGIAAMATATLVKS
jgi:2-C-methyl-D-erythritol 4-phosphate cytidylyltransferase/2-C-methyl-D-erythritol 2,4-cyclodiphosphate synthase